MMELLTLRERALWFIFKVSWIWNPNIWYQLKIRNNNDEIAANEVSEDTHAESH